MPTTTPLRAALVVEQLWQSVPGGSGTYIRELAGALSRRQDVRPVGLAARHPAGPTADWRVDIPVRQVPLPRRVLYAVWQRGALRAEVVLPGADVVHATTWAIPPTRRPLVVTVHDLAFLREPAHFTAHGNAFFRRALAAVRDRAHAVVVPSWATADECVAAGLDPQLVHVVPHGVDVPDVTAAQVAAARRRHDLPERYVMWAGTVEPRKNVPTLLDAYARLGDAPDLVLVGPRGWGEVPEVPAALRRRVHTTGRVTREDLHALYAGADAFVFPSLAEGFGLPVLEAMAHGVPVVTSRGTACAEVLGTAGVLVDPEDPADVARGIDMALGDRSADLAQAGARRAATFSWDAAAEATLAAYRAAQDRSAQDRNAG
ncbi:glycosyltransferase family 4 protein [Cellulomonas endometrii]|uniref:glycosyltransferase family 4 protein n=1 Tax=Cellulomonas endometrii TaxID=3036301 RepID=UPI0024AD4488|nr:glycosyltransferase family 1 protein [Cellulomonas endometrii]